MIIRPESVLPHSGEHGVYLHPRQDDLRVLTVGQVRDAEARAYAQMPSFTLMARAGQAAWHWARTQCGDDKRPWLILAGTGNNGGDAFVLARHAHLAGIAVTVHATGATGETAGDALRARAELQAAGVHIADAEALIEIVPSGWACVIDGLLGIGARNPPAGQTARLISLVNAARHPRTLALDIPSGLDADTGEASKPCLHATHTLSFIAAKPGLFTADGPDVCGQTCVATIKLDEGLATEDASGGLPALSALSDRTILSWWPQRRLNSHKGTAGDVVILGGDAGMTGAAILAGRAAVQMGAGRVFLGLLDGPHSPGYDPLVPEMMLRPAESLSGHGGVWVIGPGAGQSERMQILLRQLLRQWHDDPVSAPRAVVLDADALNLVAADPALAVRLQSLDTLRIITPHPLEAARLLARSVSAIQGDRLGAAVALSRQLDAIVVLKGMGSVVGSDTGCAINLSGGPALASGGTGDVLAGTVGAVLSQMMGQWSASAKSPNDKVGGKDNTTAHSDSPYLAHTAWKAALLTTFLHGAACDALPQETGMPVLLNASDLPARMRQLLMKKDANL